MKLENNVCILHTDCPLYFCIISVYLIIYYMPLSYDTTLMRPTVGEGLDKSPYVVTLLIAAETCYSVTFYSVSEIDVSYMYIRVCSDCAHEYASCLLSWEVNDQSWC